jgi:hypothetical protein
MTTHVDLYVLAPCTVRGRRFEIGHTVVRVPLLEANRLVEARVAEVKCDSDTRGPATGAAYVR